jgi:hypothetical protein
VGRDGEVCRDDLGQAETGIFLREGLDGANHVDPVPQIKDLLKIPDSLGSPVRSRVAVVSAGKSLDSAASKNQTFFL